jgi:hypothetical protein
MRGNLRLAIVALAAFLGMAGARARGDGPGLPGAAASCGDYGTSVHFEKTPSDAARKALKEEKLVLVLHVSGDFENPDFT